MRNAQLSPIAISGATMRKVRKRKLNQLCRTLGAAAEGEVIEGLLSRSERITQERTCWFAKSWRINLRRPEGRKSRGGYEPFADTITGGLTSPRSPLSDRSRKRGYFPFSPSSKCRPVRATKTSSSVA